ncbi:ribosome maturation factor RimM [Sandaracinobacter sp. RS1-74]|uniref:ribosome maturation factor RimM n=1 Tax=Sandaracinobacteroides sayramensis TaxID=2913411 RepID=UPI001EDB40D1|nr:ribosome maturation factor RimM [Sandaracinobacteroides sayramensis]MCG2839807.1 ribosome maturation factor RimM [Sandaracinobacteroides sayramensis]
MAAVAGAHGVAGEVRLKLFTASADNLKPHARFEAGGRLLTLKSVRPGPQGAVARFAEIGDRTAAEGLRGTLLTVPRESLPELPPGEYYWHDLLGLKVVSPAGDVLGEVVAVENFGASDLLEIARPDGARVLVPLIPAAVPVVAEPLVIDPEWLQ